MPRSAEFPKTLLMTSTRPGIGSVGELFLASLAKVYGPGKLWCLAATAPSYETGVLDPELDWLPIVAKPLPPEYHWQYKDNPVKRWVRKHIHIDLLENALEPIVDEACRIVQQEKIQLLWLVLNSPSMILIASKVLKRTGLPSTAIVWDPIDSITEQQQVDPISRRVLNEKFDDLVLKLRSCGVASSGMQDYFKNKWSELPTRVLINTPRSNLPDGANPVQRSTSKITVTFAGSLYAQSELLGFFHALNELKWQIDGRPVEFKVFSNSIYLPLSSNSARTNFVFGGYLNESELHSELLTSHIAYLPYWFDPSYADAVRRCFPAKLATYVASGCPVLFNGPKESSPAEFLSRFKVGCSVHSSSPKKIEEAIRRLALDDAFLKSYDAERKRALEEELGSEIFRERFHQLIDLCNVSSKF